MSGNQASNECFRGSVRDNDAYLRNSSPAYDRLVGFYKVEQVNPLMQGWAVRLESAKEKTAFDAIREHADRNIEKAQQLIE